MPPNEDHFRKLERTYLAAPTNQYYKPQVHISEGETEIALNPTIGHVWRYFRILLVHLQRLQTDRESDQ
jgi:hypothetical protein